MSAWRGKRVRRISTRMLQIKTVSVIRANGGAKAEIEEEVWSGGWEEDGEVA